MPTFPRYNSKNQLTSQLPGPLMEKDRTGEVVAQAGNQLGKAIGDFGVKWQQGKNTIQKTQAEAKHKTTMLDIQNRASIDPDEKNSYKYMNEIEKLTQTSLSEIDDPQARAEMAIDLNYQSRVGQIQVENVYRKKMVGVGQANAERMLDMYAQGHGSEADIKENLKLWTEAGLYDAKDAQKLEAEYVNKQRFNSFLTEFRTDPVAAEKKVLEGSYGMDIESSEKARSKLKELKYMQKEAEGNLYGEMTLGVLTGDTGEDDINDAIAANKLNPNEGITEAHGKQLLAAKYKDITQRIGDKQYAKHKKAIDFVFSSSGKDRVKGYEAILEAYNNGMTPDETKFLKKILDTKQDIKFSNEAASGKKLIETLFGARPKDVQKETQALLSYAKRIANGETPYQAARQTSIEVIQEEHPATIADPDLVVAFTPGKGLKNIPKVKRESSA